MYWFFSLKHAIFFKFIITSKNDIENAECVPVFRNWKCFLITSGVKMLLIKRLTFMLEVQQKAPV